MGATWRQRWSAQPWWVQAGTIVYGIGFLVGTCTHALDLVRVGIDAYFSSAPTAVRVLFTSLVLIDPLTAVLVVQLRPNALWLAAGVMAVDLPVNWYVRWAGVADTPGWMLVLQNLFGLFVFSTFMPLWRRVR